MIDIVQSENVCSEPGLVKGTERYFGSESFYELGKYFMSFHNKTCIRSAMESVIVGCGFRICLVKLGDQLNPTFTSGSG